MLSFLPLTHVFARTLYYGALARGTSLYFSHPDRLVEDLSTVRPTIISTVPRVLEKVYSKIMLRFRMKGTDLTDKDVRDAIHEALTHTCSIAVMASQVAPITCEYEVGSLKGTVTAA